MNKLLLIIPFLFSLCASAQIPTDEIRRYNFDQGDLSNLGTMTSGDLTTNGTASTIVSGFDGTAMSALDMNGDIYNGGDSTISSQESSYSFWVKVDASSTSTARIMNHYNDINGNGGVYIYLQNGKITCSFEDTSDNSRIIETPVVNDGLWHHITVTISQEIVSNTRGYTGRIYLDGVVTQTRTTNGRNNSSSTPGWITFYSNPTFTLNDNLSFSVYFQDIIDEVKVYDRALTNSEVVALATNNTNPPLSQVFIDADATGNDDGTSWSDAYTSLQTAIQLNPGAEFWVADGTYSPGSLRTDSFILAADDTKIYGGFNGTETQLSQRDAKINLTILDGDVNSDDTGVGYSGANRDDNNYNLITITGNNTIIDGLILRNAQANGTTTSTQEGAAIFASGNGLNLIDCIIERNLVTRSGVVRSIGTNGTINILNTKFSENYGNAGLILYTRANTSGLAINMTNCLIEDNTLAVFNAGAGNTGLIWLRQDLSGAQNVVFSNCTMVNNTNVTRGSGATMINASSAVNGSTVNVEINNSIAYGNRNAANNVMITLGDDSGFGGPDNYIVDSSIAEDNFSNVRSSAVGTVINSSDLDPLFTSSTDFNLRVNSPAVNQGNNSKVQSGTATDIDNNVRIQQSRVDLGCYESPHATVNGPFGVVYVDIAATGNNNGTSWANAYADIQPALDNYSDGQQIWVAAGTYIPTAGGAARFASYNITIDNTILLGGFNSTETSANERDSYINLTIIDADVNGDDTGVDFNGFNRGENLYQCMEILTSKATVDGFILKNAHANGAATSVKEGAGIAVTANTSVEMDIVLRNIVFENNVVHRAGVLQVVDDNGEFTLENCIFKNNLGVFGTTIYTRPAQGNGLTFNVNNCLFDGNMNKNLGSSSASSGIIYHRRDFNSGYNVTYTNNTFVNNILASTNNPNAPILRATFSVDIDIFNTIFWNNTNSSGNTTRSLATDSSGAGGTYEVRNSLSMDGFPTVGASNKSNIITTDPLFISATDFRLQSGSPAIDTGDNNFVNSVVDLAGNDRIINTTVDMGVYEFDATAGIDDIEQISISLYPNPVTDILNVVVDNSAFAKAEIYNLQGQHVASETSTRISVTSLNSGVYLIKVVTQEGRVLTDRFIKN